MRIKRWCTDRWKKKPLAMMERDILGHTAENPCLHALGISTDEATRAHVYTDEDRLKLDSPYNVQKIYYPLIEKNLSRDDCKNIITSHGFPVPPKSGCYFCPYMRVADMRQQAIYQKDQWQKAIALEQNAEGYPDFILRHKPLVNFVFDDTLDNFMEVQKMDSDLDNCESGYCMV